MGGWDIYCAVCGLAFSTFGVRNKSKIYHRSRFEWLNHCRIVGNTGKGGTGKGFLSGPAETTDDDTKWCTLGPDSCITEHPEWNPDGYEAYCYSPISGDYDGWDTFPVHFSCYHILFESVKHLQSKQRSSMVGSNGASPFLNASSLYATMFKIFDQQSCTRYTNSCSSLGLDYGPEAPQEQYASYYDYELPATVDPIQIPEMQRFLLQLPVQTATVAERIVRDNSLVNLPKELRLMILDRLVFKDLINLAHSGVLDTLAPPEWWRRRLTRSFPYLWEFRDRDFHVDNIDWAMVFAHLWTQSRHPDDTNDDDDDDDESEQEDFGIVDVDDDDRGGSTHSTEEQSEGIIDNMTAKELEEHLLSLRAPNNDVALRVEKEVCAAGNGETDREDALIDLPGLFSRARIWKICTKQIANFYLIEERVRLTPPKPIYAEDVFEHEMVHTSSTEEDSSRIKHGTGRFVTDRRALGDKTVRIAIAMHHVGIHDRLSSQLELFRIQLISALSDTIEVGHIENTYHGNYFIDTVRMDNFGGLELTLNTAADDATQKQPVIVDVQIVQRSGRLKPRCAVSLPAEYPRVRLMANSNEWIVGLQWVSNYRGERQNFYKKADEGIWAIAGMGLMTIARVE